MLSVEFRASLEAATTAYQAALKADDKSLAYLSGRGIDSVAAEFYRLGIVDGSVAEHEVYTGWYSIPYLTRAGVVTIQFRNPDPEADPKYLTPYPKRLYNTQALDKADRLGYVGIAEGEFDAEISDWHCDIPTVGIPGVETYGAHPEWRETLSGYPLVLVFKDNDKPNPLTGKRPGDELARRILSEIDSARLIQLPGKDLNDTFLNHGGREAIRKAAGL